MGHPGAVTHNPVTDWCACEPGGVERCDYRLLADTVISGLNPPDKDEAEVALCTTAVEHIAEYVRSLSCTCPSGSLPDGACGRCAVLGQHHGQPVQR